MIKHDVAITLVRMLAAIGAVLAPVSAGSAQSQRAAIDRVVPLHVPDESTIPEGPVGTAVRYCKKVLTDTQTYETVRPMPSRTESTIASNVR